MLHDLRRERRIVPAVYVTAGIGLALSYGVVRWNPYQQGVYRLLGFAAPLALLYGIRRRRPERPAAWYLIAIGIAVSVSGDVVYDAYGWLGHTAPFPSAADPLYIAGLALLIAGIMALSFRAGRGLGTWMLDSLIVGAAGGLLVFVKVIGPNIDAAGSVLERSVAAAYPSLDVVLLLAIVPLVLLRTRNVALLAVLAYGLLTFVGDMVYAGQVLNDTYVDGGWVDVTWLLSFVALGAAGLVPSLATVEATVQRPWDDWARLAVLAASIGVGYGLLATTKPNWNEDDFVVTVVGSGVMLLLGFARVGLLHAERRASERRLIAENQRLDAFERVQRAISAGGSGLQALLRLICEETVPLVSGGAFVALAEGDKLTVRAVAGTTATALHGRTLSPPSLTSAAMAADAVLICDDVETDDRVDLEICRAAGLRSLAAAPVHYGGAAIGALVATSSETAHFGPRIARTMQLMGSLVSVAIGRSSEFAARRALDAIVESSEDAIIGMTLDDTVLSWNAGAERMYGYTAEEVVGRRLDAIVPEHLRAELAGFRERVEHGEAIAPYETERMRKDGERIVVSQSVSPVRDLSGRIVGASLIERDMTERRQLEEELHQAQKLEAVGRLAGGIAHDFNNLLLAIQGYASLALARVGGDELSHQYIEQVLSAARQSADLTQQLLAYSRKQVLQPTVVDPNDVVREIQRMLVRLIGEEIELECNLAPDVGLVLVDRSRLAQVVMNLGVNARDAMSGTGTISISTEAVTVEPGGSSAAGGAPPGRYAKLTVRDTGSGMDAATRAKIFDPFFTTKADGEGTGLGLSSVHGTVSQSGGFIAVASEPGHGTEFAIYLPEYTGEAAARKEPARSVTPPPQHGRVLLVEDMLAVREVVAELLSDSGYEVTTAANGEEALALAQRHTFDLLLTDVVMPGMSGVDLALRLRAQRPELAVILTSGYPHDRTEGDAKPPADAVFLQKPYSLGELRAATQTALSA